MFTPTGWLAVFRYMGTANQTNLTYPDKSSQTKGYDALGQLTQTTDGDGGKYTYTYDGMGRMVKMEYPHGWVEEYEYDSMGQLLRVTDTDPTGKDLKQQKHAYQYDDCGNMIYEYMRGNGTGEATTENTYTYDALHRITGAKENYGNDNRTYTYDSLGNLTYETSLGNKTVDYKLNNLNQITTSSDDGWKTSTAYTYDQRGNLVQELYTKNKKESVTGAYTYDETNKMVKGVNDIGESSEYLYNGLGALVTNTWTIKKNAYGYHDVQPSAVVEGETVVDVGSGKKEKKEKKTAEEVAASPELNKTSTVTKQFVVDYTTATFEPLTEHEVGGLDYRYVYGHDRLSVNITGVETSSGNLVENGNQIRLYYHMDFLGTADYLTSPVTGKVTSWTHYNEWGEITHNAVLKTGQRELDLVKRYATHDYDAVLGMYYAKARMYDAENRRFAAVDPVKGRITEPMTMVQYLYVVDNPLRWVDPAGRVAHNPGDIISPDSIGRVTTGITPDTSTSGGKANSGTAQKPASNQVEIAGPESQQTKRVNVWDSVSSYASGLWTSMADGVAPTAGMVLQGAADAYNYLAPYLAYVPTNGYDFYTPPTVNYDVYTPIINSGDIYSRFVSNVQQQSELAAQNAANPSAFYAGRVDGDTLLIMSSMASGSVGIDMMSTGAGMTGAGLATAASGGGVVVAAEGAAISVAGGAVVAVSAQVAATASGNLGDDLSKFEKCSCEGSPDNSKVTSGTSRAPEQGEPGSVYEQTTPQNELKSRTTYGENKRPAYRDDFQGKPHFDKKSKQYLLPHRHSFTYNAKGQPTGERVTEIPKQ